MYASMTLAAQGDQILFLVLTTLRSEAEMVHFEVPASSAVLTTPAVSLQHVQTDSVVVRV
jgi:hypothetical protein